LQAHTFTTLTADLLQDGDDLSLSLGLQLLDVIAIVEGKSVTAGVTLTHSQLIAEADRVRAYLKKNVRLKVNGVVISGDCLGYIPDLTNPPKPGEPVLEILPDRIPFLLVWTLPKNTTAFEIEFPLLMDLVGSGVIQASLHQGDKTQSQFVNLGKSAIFAVGGQPSSTQPEAVKPSDSSAVVVGEEKIKAIPAHVEPGTDVMQDSSGMRWWDLLSMGFSHIIPEGLDHILFVVCLFLLSPKLKPLLIQVTAFTLAHSVTLGLAMAGWVLLPSRLVETLIAASIVVMAVENLFMREVKPWRWMLVFVFGLVHGLGFAGSFSTLHLPPEDFIRPLLLLNIGIEFGQLSVVAGCAAVTVWMWQRPWYTRAVIYPASSAIALMALWWTIERAFALG
jgi:HupE / UreJ protein